LQTFRLKTVVDRRLQTFKIELPYFQKSQLDPDSDPLGFEGSENNVNHTTQDLEHHTGSSDLAWILILFSDPDQALHKQIILDPY
jgi:hypothetical protein